MSKEARSLEFTVAIEATPEEIWRALTDGEAITRWFAPEARVTPGLGGSVLLSWGPGMEGEASITAWEPNKRFAWTERAGTDSPRVVEFTIEAADGGTTVLRLVQSGFSAAASFDSEYDSTSGGWQSYLALLRLDLEDHRGQAGQHVCQFKMIEGDRTAIWDRLLNAIAYKESGERYTARLADGTPLTGRQIWIRQPGYLVLSLEGDLNGALALFAENCGGQIAITTSWYLKGDTMAARKTAANTTVFTQLD